MDLPRPSSIHVNSMICHRSSSEVSTYEHLARTGRAELAKRWHVARFSGQPQEFPYNEQSSIKVSLQSYGSSISARLAVASRILHCLQETNSGVGSQLLPIFTSCRLHLDSPTRVPDLCNTQSESSRLAWLLHTLRPFCDRIDGSCNRANKT